MKINNDPVYVKRRRVALAVLIVVLIVLVVCIGRLVGGDEDLVEGVVHIDHVGDCVHADGAGGADSSGQDAVG